MNHRSLVLPLVGALSLALVACEAESQTGPEDGPPITEQPEDETAQKEGSAELYGDALTRGTEFVDFDDLAADPQAFAGMTMQTEGVVRANCQKRGCWMEVRSPNDAASPGITVRFLNYGFFIPLDSRGTIVRVEGTIEIDDLTVEEVEDLLSEGHDPGIVNEDGTAQVVTFTASGVEMWNRDQ